MSDVLLKQARTLKDWFLSFEFCEECFYIDGDLEECEDCKVMKKAVLLEVAEQQIREAGLICTKNVLCLKDEIEVLEGRLKQAQQFASKLPIFVGDYSWTIKQIGDWQKELLGVLSGEPKTEASK